MRCVLNPSFPVPFILQCYLARSRLRQTHWVAHACSRGPQHCSSRDERLEFVRLRKDLWETMDGTIDYLNLIFDATFCEEKVLAKVVFRSYGRTSSAILRPSTWLLSYSELATYKVLPV